MSAGTARYEVLGDNGTTGAMVPGGGGASIMVVVAADHWLLNGTSAHRLPLERWWWSG